MTRGLDIRVLLLAVLCCHSSFILAQLTNPCIERRTCSACLAADKDCGWCQSEHSESFSASSYRCNRIEELVSSGCDVTNIVSPQNELTVTSSIAFSPSSQVTITPQRIRVQLRAGSYIVIPLQVKVKAADVRRRYLKLKPRPPSNVAVTILSQCAGFQRRRQWVKCPGPLQENQIISFEVRLTLRACLRQHHRQNIRIGAPGVRGRVLLGRIEGLCRCQCEVDAAESSSSYCNNNGGLSCGVCLCSPGHYGAQCECNAEGSYEHSCQRPNSTVICSGRGQCICGACSCFNNPDQRVRYYGAYCECEDHSCPRHNGYICSGVTHGRCTCGRCVCAEGYSGAACEHRTTVDGCRNNRGVICNNIGTCVAGACTCPGHHYGRFCECSDITCPRHNGLVCAGPEKGRCVCGQCQCTPGFSGESCGQSTNTETCRGSNGVICNNIGTCVAGVCMCPRHYTGRFCECSDITCVRHNGLICAGPEKGRCVCGQCQCRTGFSGESCGQSTNVESCRASNGQICNGRGQCMSGRCRCDSPMYGGATCEDCPACLSQCIHLKDCVLCVVFQSGPLSPEQCHSACTSMEYIIVDSLGEQNSQNMCSFVDSDDGSYFFFSYQHRDSRLHITAQRNKVFPGR